MKLAISIIVLAVSFYSNVSNAYTSGGCIDKFNVTSITSTNFNHCQQYNGSVPCNEDTVCKWDVVQYYKNYCNVNTQVVAVDGAACPSGYGESSFGAQAYPNPKFKCCKKGGGTGTGTGTGTSTGSGTGTITNTNTVTNTNTSTGTGTCTGSGHGIGHGHGCGGKKR